MGPAALGGPGLPRAPALRCFPASSNQTPPSHELCSLPCAPTEGRRERVSDSPSLDPETRSLPSSKVSFECARCLRVPVRCSSWRRSRSQSKLVRRWGAWEAAVPVRPLRQPVPKCRGQRRRCPAPLRKCSGRTWGSRCRGRLHRCSGRTWGNRCRGRLRKCSVRTWGSRCPVRLRKCSVRTWGRR